MLCCRIAISASTEEKLAPGGPAGIAGMGNVFALSPCGGRVSLALHAARQVASTMDGRTCRRMRKE
jgi:hypothetical protein